MDLKLLLLTISLIFVFAGYAYWAMLLFLVLGIAHMLPRMHSRTPMISLCLLLYTVPRFPFLLSLRTSPPSKLRKHSIKLRSHLFHIAQFLTNNIKSRDISLENSSGAGWLVRLNFGPIVHPEPPSPLRFYPWGGGRN